MRRTGFTLIELLVVTSIVAILASLLLPAIRMVKAAALKTQCLSNQRQLVMAVIAYASDFDGIAPLFYDGAQKQGSYWLRRSWEYRAGRLKLA